MSDRKVVFLLPGLLCDFAVWRHQVRALSAQYDVRVAQFFGYDSLTAMARGVLADAPERFAVAGHSMGGRVAVELFNLAPERVERMALLSTGMHPLRSGEAASRQELIDVANGEGMEALAARWIPPMLAPGRVGDAALVDEITAMICRATPLIYERQIRALLNRPEAESVLPRIACPLDVIVGREDGWSPVAQHEDIVARAGHGRLTIIEKCGHMAQQEQPEAVNAALLRWLED